MKTRNNIYKVSVLVFILDQMVKILIRKTMNLYQEISIIPKFFSLCYVQNSGAAFSVLEDATLLLIMISVIFILLIDNTIKKEQQNFGPVSIISLGMILGGIFGNLIDRILYRSVVDYLSFSVRNYHFPIFNIADIGIVVGVFLMLWDVWKNRKRKDESK